MKAEIEHLSVGYQDDDHLLLALDRVDLTLQPGRITALVGESGSGKTTLGKAMMGLLPDNARVNGSLRLDGEAIDGLDDVAMNAFRWRHVAMVFQNGAANLNPVHRLVDQVAEPLIRRLGEAADSAREKACAEMARMGLDDGLTRRYPHELSGGQIQRALLAMALVMDPDVLILDEPTAALDAMTKHHIAGVLRQLARQGKAILLITHDLDLAANVANTIAVLYLGQIMEYLPAPNLFHPRHPYTLALARSYPGMETVRDLGGIRGDAFYRLVHAHPRENQDAAAHAHMIAPGSVHEEGHAPTDGCLFQPRCTQAVAACRRGDMPMIQDDGHRVRCARGGIAQLMQIEEVSKFYNNIAALQPTDLTLWTGEVLCIVGETGSGKSTLAMITSGVLAPDHGRRAFDGKDMADWIKKDYKTLASRIGVIYQHPSEAVSHRLNVFDAVAEPLRIQKRSMPSEKVRERVLRALADVRLSTRPEFLKRYPHELNMGSIQRLCIARALVHEPVLLVADEPTSALDPSVQAKVLKLLLELQIEKGLTMLFVTHDIGLARKIGDRIGVMLDGRIVEIGPADRIFNHPGHPYAAMLIQSAGNDVVPFQAVPPAAAGSAECCPFLQRCERMTSDCQTGYPAPVNLDSGRHLAWCFRPLYRGPEDKADGIEKGTAFSI